MFWSPQQLARITKGFYTGFRRWYVNRRRDQIAVAVRVHEGMAEGRPETTVRIEHTIPFASRRARYLVTTAPQHLLPGEFGPDTETVNRAAIDAEDTGSGLNRKAGKGRVIFLVNLRAPMQPAIAALAFHVAEAGPPMIRCCAGQCDELDQLTERTVVALLLLKAYAHVLSGKLRHGGVLEARADNGREAAVLRRLGFTRSTPGGIYRQEPFVRPPS